MFAMLPTAKQEDMIEPQFVKEGEIVVKEEDRKIPPSEAPWVQLHGDVGKCTIKDILKRQGRGINLYIATNGNIFF